VNVASELYMVISGCNTKNVVVWNTHGRYKLSGELIYEANWEHNSGLLKALRNDVDESSIQKNDKRWTRTKIVAHVILCFI
jgi:hypothetical protein